MLFNFALCYFFFTLNDRFQILSITPKDWSCWVENYFFLTVFKSKGNPLPERLKSLAELYRLWRLDTVFNRNSGEPN